MGVKDTLRRMFRRRKEAQDEEIVPDNNLAVPQQEEDSSCPLAEASARVITPAQMEQSGSLDQAASIFFAKLPLELRRKIYRSVWESYLQPCHVSPSSPGSDLRLHIYADGARDDRSVLSHGQCLVHPGALGQDDDQAIEPWALARDHNLAPPMWFWLALVRRLQWGRHWSCQEKVMRRWDPITGNITPGEKSPFLPLFLTCKKIYWESIICFFEMVTPIFTSSEDAIVYFTRSPHPFLSHLRSLELSFSNPNDRLFLARINPQQHLGANDDRDDQNRLNIGEQLWTDMLQAVHSAVPRLRDLDITLGGRMAATQEQVLSRFGHQQDDLANETEEGVNEIYPVTTYDLATQDPDKTSPSTEFWRLRGKLAVHFKLDQQRYIQRGDRMVRLVA
ncbi:hypothetical protein B0H63DRAFT_519147 [Podospora didyma]|uniref:Uncharacterized protein n=1 Tax=Podospora didyma TaxID=330526 RepID=A0AAE0NY87_9PEZI|nr:hypothetical protein B0H63DRAFT_519147 [Podospora didyma]